MEQSLVNNKKKIEKTSEFLELIYWSDSKSLYNVYLFTFYALYHVMA